MTTKEIRQAIGEALASGNDTEVDRLAVELAKAKVEEHKADLVKATAEAEALAGDREALATTIKDMIDKDTGVKASLEKVKAYGFVYSIDHTQADKDGLKTKVIGGCALRVPEVKGKARGTGGGGKGAVKDQTGLSRHELVEKYGTDEEKATIQLAFDNATSRKDSAKYSAEKPAVKRILADHPELIQR